MTLRPTIHIVCVGAVYMDTIWTVPHFPKEDTKLRAEGVERRRGGNPANTLEVLSSIVSGFAASDPPEISPYNLYLIADLPARESLDTRDIHKTLLGVQLQGPYHEEHQAAACSMIILSKESGTRSVVSHSGLPAMTTSDLIEAMPPVSLDDPQNMLWYHFEGRNPEVTLDFIKHLRAAEKDGRLKISVECENPERTAIAQAAILADVVFYSKLWVERNGYTDPRAFLQSQINGTNFVRESVLLVCPWGEQGAIAVQYNRQAGIIEWATCSAWYPADEPQARVVDTIGAGDTFVAGMLFGVSNYPERPLKQNLRYAVEIATRKVYRVGFHGLGIAMRSPSGHIDFESSKWFEGDHGLGSKSKTTGMSSVT